MSRCCQGKVEDGMEAEEELINSESSGSAVIADEARDGRRGALLLSYSFGHDITRMLGN